MATTDPIAQFLTMIRNASRARKERVTVPLSNLTLHILEIMKDEKFIDNFKVVEEEGNKRFARVHLKYLEEKKPAFKGLVRISKPGLRHYVGSDKVPRVLGGIGIAVLSTSSGILTDRDARKQKVGGEVLCHIW